MNEQIQQKIQEKEKLKESGGSEAELIELNKQIQQKIEEKEKLKESGGSEGETGKESGAGGTVPEPVGANNSKVIEDPYKITKQSGIEDPYGTGGRDKSSSDPYSGAGGLQSKKW